MFSWVFLRYPCTRSSAHSMLLSPILVSQHLDRNFDSLINIHCLFLALAHEFPKTKREAYSRLKNFTPSEIWRLKKTCPSLGNLFSLFMIVDSICSTCTQLRSDHWKRSWSTIISNENKLPRLGRVFLSLHFSLEVKFFSLEYSSLLVLGNSWVSAKKRRWTLIRDQNRRGEQRKCWRSATRRAKKDPRHLTMLSVSYEMFQQKLEHELTITSVKRLMCKQAAPPLSILSVRSSDTTSIVSSCPYGNNFTNIHGNLPTVPGRNGSVAEGCY